MKQLLDLLGEIVINLINGFGYGGVFFSMLLESACIPLPSEIILPFAGYLVFTGKFLYWKITLIAALANVIGGLFAYLIGKYCGRPLILRYGKYLLLNEYKLRKTERFFDKYGELTVFFGRMLPVIRTFISLPAGIAKMNILKMTIYTFLGSLPWCALLIWTGKELGENWQNLKSIFHQFHLILGFICILILILIVILFIFRKLNKNK